MNDPTTIDLTKALWPELFQTERSAQRHPQREAERLGAGPAADAMRAIVEHATRAQLELERLAAARGYRAARSGSAVGRAFSEVRDKGVDRLMTAEKSYRGTLLGLHHGVGVVELLAAAAREGNDGELVASCARWLERRRELVLTAERALDFFAQNPDQARAPAAGGAFWRWIQRVGSLSPSLAH